MSFPLADPVARRRWDRYFAEVDRILADAGAYAAELGAELRAHAADSMTAMPEDRSEIDRLDTALTRLGRPIDYLRPLLADELIERGTRTYRPATIARGLVYSVMAGSRRAVLAVVFGTGYLLLAAFTAMAQLKPFWGPHVGLFRQADGTLSAGIVASTAGAHELLGWWTVPIALVLAVLLYTALTKGLRACRERP